MNDDVPLLTWLNALHWDLVTCGRPHPGFPNLFCGSKLGHSTLGRTGRERAHAAVDADGCRFLWTQVADHQWQIDQKRRGRHPAGGEEAR